MTAPEKIIIRVFGSQAQLVGRYPKDLVSSITSYAVQGAEFSTAYRRGKWDGRKHLLNYRSGAFPAGLVESVRKALVDLNLNVEVADHRIEPSPKNAGFDLDGVKFEYPYDYQLDACLKMVEHKQGIVKAATNAGKCLAPNTPVRLFDGRVEPVESLMVGDYLMGPDNNPRMVLSTTYGRGPLFTVTQDRGMSYVCNDAHILALQNSKGYVEISVSDFLKLSKKEQKDHRSIQASIDYPSTPPPRDPYQHGLDVVFSDSLVKEEDIPDKEWEPFLVNDREVRLQFLAGILDSAAYFTASTGEYELTLNRPHYMDRVFQVARSLGYDCTYPVKKTEKLFNNTSKDVYRMHIQGVGKDNAIPCRLERKQPTNIISPKARGSAFTITPKGEGAYFGFTLSGDGLFLLEDYTVTHNTEIACGVTKHLGLKTLFIVSTQELMYQGRKRFQKRLGLGDDEVGIIGDGKWEPGSFVTIAMLPTLEARIDNPECISLLKESEVLFFDECHRMGSETWFTVATLCPAYYRFGLSGTPLDRTDGADLRLIGAIGEVIFDIPNKFLVERGVSAKAEIIWDRINSPVLKRGLRYPAAYKQGVSENPELLSKVVEWTKIFREQGLSVLILCEEISHGKLIDDALWTHDALDGLFVPHQFIHGSEDSATRRQALDSFAARDLPVLIGSSILDEGVDVHSIDALILAGSRKSKIRTMQRLGRGLRGDKLIVVEFANFCHKHLLTHSHQRLQDYLREECFPIHYSGPNADLVRKLWNKDGS